MRVVALEGPCLSGKSTLADACEHHLRELVVHLAVSQDYVDAAGPDFVVPPTPGANAEAEIAGMRAFLSVDATRWRLALSRTPRPELVLLDRSIHTLLAHRYAVERLVGVRCFEDACALADQYCEPLPDAIFYLDSPHELLDSRSRGSRPRPAFLRNPEYNECFRQYFFPVLRWSSARVVLLLYNADSVVDADGLEALRAMASTGVPVAQQSSLFLANVPRLLAAGHIYLAAHGLRQSRWTLQHELPRYLWSRRQIPRMPPWLEQLGLVHCVGHGLLVRCDVLDSVGGFPIVELGIEDLALGYVLKAAGYHVEPVPVLENAETPDRARVLWLQKASWFLGVLGYLQYWKLAATVAPLRCKRIVLLATTAQGIYDAAIWILAGPSFVLLLVVGALTGHGLCALGLYLSYVYVPMLLTVWLWTRLPSGTFPRPPTGALFAGLVAYAIVPIAHSAPAVHGLWWALRLALGRPALRPKTER